MGALCDALASEEARSPPQTAAGRGKRVAWKDGRPTVPAGGRFARRYRHESGPALGVRAGMKQQGASRQGISETCWAPRESEVRAVIDSALRSPRCFLVSPVPDRHRFALSSRASTLSVTDPPSFFRTFTSPVTLPTGLTGEAAFGSSPSLTGVGPKKTQSAFPGIQ